MSCNIILIEDDNQKSEICSSIIKTLPEWFGIPEANEKYIRDVVHQDVFAAFVKDDPVGLIAIKYHYQTTAEIWWMGIKPDFHGCGIGKLLFSVAKEHVIGNGAQFIIVNTLSERSADENYRRTRKFYQTMGLMPLFEDSEDDPVNPMMWMISSL